MRFFTFTIRIVRNVKGIVSFLTVEVSDISYEEAISQLVADFPDWQMVEVVSTSEDLF